MLGQTFNAFSHNFWWVCQQRILFLHYTYKWLNFDINYWEIGSLLNINKQNIFFLCHKKHLKWGDEVMKRFSPIILRALLGKSRIIIKEIQWSKSLIDLVCWLCYKAWIMLPTAAKSQPIWATNWCCMLRNMSSVFILDVYDHDASHHVPTLWSDHLTGKSFFYKNGPNPASFCLFSFFSHDKYSTNTINEKSIDGVLGTWTQGGRMVGADESTELWRHPWPANLSCLISF